ncbi:hypothetical protein HJC23_008895 [Cyclotella cryptica]|uniref:Sulfotransferase family protein n=1 Tax=Cyclotella cryptica TaxID=29204 RepID=A0ABD3NPG0_9STRA|eukprot:CCRYP_020224-RA/>CCRYP_020224-RA protein AED:0.04 eAED:0.04 QI:0/-1/0/1/-1/1/1/0/313
MTSAEAFRHCYVNVTTYGNHVPEYSNLLAAVSDEYQLIYRNIPKSASSTGRHVIQDFMEGEDRRLSHDDLINLVNEEGYQLISFVREPLNRFYSSYDEAFFRIGPWMGDGDIVRDKPRVRKWYHNNKHKMDKYPYLYEGMRTLDDFRAMYCPSKILRMKNPLKCNDVPSIDDGNLAHRFEQFVRDYNGLDPFDVHLNLQVSNLVFGVTGEPLPVSVLYNASDAEREWREIAKVREVEINDGDITHARKISRRFNVDMVSKETKRKICKILALDYCCLNLELPEVCRIDNEEDVNGVYCRMKEVDGKVIIEDWR